MIPLIFDTETTSANEDREIIEAGFLQLRSEKDLAGISDRISIDIVSEPFEQRYKPSKPSTFGAMAVHHILPEELEECSPSSSFKLPDCDYIIGHSIDFDWEVAGSPDVKRICTYAMAQHVWQEADSYSQTALLYMALGPSTALREMLRDAHNALQDCYLTRMLLNEILRKKLDITTWSELWQFSEDSRIPLRMPITQARGELLTDIDDGLLQWCLDQYWLPGEHPYLHQGLVRENQRRQGSFDD